MRPFVVHARGDWPSGAVAAEWRAADSRRIEPEVELAIEAAWADAKARLGDKLFDGPMCRLERFDAAPDRLRLVLSPTSYRAFLGTNLHNARLADRFGRDVLANPVGLSTALETSDGYLLLGRRNAAVAYYPDRVHPFAGALEPREPIDVFAEIRRELHEELGLDAADVPSIRCVGLVEDRSLRQPELIFVARTAHPRDALEARLDREEHHAVYAARAERAHVQRVMSDALLTPVAVASLSLWLERS